MTRPPYRSGAAWIGRSSANASRRAGSPCSRAAIVFGASAIFLATRSSATTLRVEPARLTIARVERGEFRDYYPVDGRSSPPRPSIWMWSKAAASRRSSSRAAPVAKGELILRFSNTNLQRNAIETETRLIENLDLLRNTQFGAGAEQLAARETLLDLEHQIIEVRTGYARYQRLGKEGAISAEVLETTRNDLARLHDKRELLKERIRQEDILSRNQLAQAKKSIERLNTSMELLGRIVQSLEVRAPISGYLSTIDAQVGQNIVPRPAHRPDRPARQVQDPRAHRPVLHQPRGGRYPRAR